MEVAMEVMKVEPVKIKNVAPKKARSQKQLEASKKNLAIMKERREYHRKMQEEEASSEATPKVEIKDSKDDVEFVPVVRKPRTKAPLPPVEYITKKHLESFKAELLAGIPQPGERLVEMPVEKIVEKPVEKIV